MVGLFVAAVTVTVHWPALSCRAFCFDDSKYLLDNSLVQHPSWKAAGRFLNEVRAPSTVDGYYQPLTMISLMLDSALGGSSDQLSPYHRTSLALHALNAALVALLLYLLFNRPIVAVLVALVFSLHPLTVEPVPWIGERKTLLAAFFSFLCLVIYIRYAQTGRRAMLWACVPIYVLALLSKPTSTPLPLLLLILDVWPLHRMNRRAVVEKLRLLLLGGLSAVVTYVSQSQSASTHAPGQYPWPQVPVVLFHNLGFYLEKISWPTALSPFYPYPQPFSPAQALVAIRCALGLSFIILLIVLRRPAPAVAYGGLFFLVALFPTLQLIRFQPGFGSDKYAYLPFFGILLILASGLSWASNSMKNFSAREGVVRHGFRNHTAMLMVASFAMILVLGVESAASRRQYRYRQDSLTLFPRMVNLAPQSGLPHLGLGGELLERGRAEEAVIELRQVVAIEPQRSEGHAKLGAALSMLGRFDEAIAQEQEATRLHPDYALAHHNWAVALAGKGEWEDAIGHYQIALRLQPRYTLAHFNLAAALTVRGRVDDAISHYREGLTLDPSNKSARLNLAVLLAEEDRLEEAQALLVEAVRRDPGDAEARNNLGVVFMDMGRLDEAERLLSEAIRLKADYADAHYNLGNVLAQRGQRSQAIRHFQEVVRIVPGHQRALEHLYELQSKPNR
jgi:tetratricopeptide (TPR) repeat protein